MRPAAAITSLLLATLAIAGCHTMRFELADGPVGQTVTERKHYFLEGLVPTRVIDVTAHCPNGAVAIMEETTFVDGLLGLVTLDVWTPRSSTYYCRAEADR
jgi:hypothetical protein